jgi:hypothetical protein
VYRTPETLAQYPFTIKKDHPENAREEEARIQNPVARSKDFFLFFLLITRHSLLVTVQKVPSV